MSTINERIFKRADILLPRVKDYEKWAVIACDQYTSQPEYWEQAGEIAGDAPSTLNLIFPEVYLSGDDSARIASINKTMKDYLAHDLFDTYRDAYIYVERTMADGSIRQGIVGCVDLEAYEFTPDAKCPIRATERTVVDRIPPRKRIRVDASLELPHVIMLCDDPKRMLIESVAAKKDSLKMVYDFDTMLGGGHITGWLVEGPDADAFDDAMDAYCRDVENYYGEMGVAPVYFAVGDGNHSLATAKCCYEDLVNVDGDYANARYALVELENIEDEAQKFEPIHRIVKTGDIPSLMTAIRFVCVDDESGYPVHCYAKDCDQIIYLDPAKGELPIAILQEFLDQYLSTHIGSIDYIHDEDAVISLSSQKNVVGFLLPPFAKDSLFPGIAKDGVLPRKTFSMGHSKEKRYYLEARKIK